VPREALVANVNQDAVMMLEQPSDLVAFGAEHSTLQAVVERAATRVGLTLSPDPMPEQNFFIRSDQFSFVKQGVPAVYAFFGTSRSAASKQGDGAMDGTAPLRDWLKTRYHSPRDDMSQRMDFAGGARYTRANFLIGYLVAQADDRPRWNRGDYFGERFGTAATRGN
jgi:Zn-dependent M28 family amino/carboxypeptidase